MDRERYNVWMRITNDWIRTGHSMRLSRPSDCFHQGTACLDSIDAVTDEILRANRQQRKELASWAKAKTCFPSASMAAGSAPLKRAMAP